MGSVINLSAVRAMREGPSAFAVAYLQICAAFATDVLKDEQQGAELHARAMAARRALAALPRSEPEPEPPQDAA